MRLPVALVDLFDLQAPGGRVTRVAVLNCLGGALLVAAGDALATLPAPIPAQITAATVSNRGQFRTIHARELFIATLDAVEQEVQARGLNDAVTLYARMQARVEATTEQLAVTQLTQPGQCIVGRLDMLHAYQLSVEHRFQLPSAAPAYHYQFMVPLAPREAIAGGGGGGVALSDARPCGVWRQR